MGAGTRQNSQQWGKGGSFFCALFLFTIALAFTASMLQAWQVIVPQQGACHEVSLSPSQGTGIIQRAQSGGGGGWSNKPELSALASVRSTQRSSLRVSSLRAALIRLQSTLWRFQCFFWHFALQYRMHRQLLQPLRSSPVLPQLEQNLSSSMSPPTSSRDIATNC